MDQHGTRTTARALGQPEATPSEARRVLKRRAAQFAVTVHDHIADTASTIGAVWTGSDRVLKAVA